MTKTAWLVLACLATGCAAQQHTDTMPMGPEADASLTAFARDILDHIGKGDFAYMKNSMCHKAIVFDIDENGTPIAKYGKAEIDGMIDHYQAMMSQGGVKTSLDVKRLECIAGHNLCVLDFDQTFAMGEQAQTFQFRATIVAKHKGDRWIWTHWHASPRNAAPTVPPAAPPAPEAPAAAPPAATLPPPAPPAPAAK